MKTKSPAGPPSDATHAPTCRSNRVHAPYAREHALAGIVCMRNLSAFQAPPRAGLTSVATHPLPHHQSATSSDGHMSPASTSRHIICHVSAWGIDRCVGAHAASDGGSVGDVVFVSMRSSCCARILCLGFWTAQMQVVRAKMHLGWKRGMTA